METCIESKVVLGYYLRNIFAGQDFKLIVSTLPNNCYKISDQTNYGVTTYSYNKKVYFQNTTICHYLKV